MIRLVVAGPHTQILSATCSACPHSAAGCCAGPPPLDWSDIGRIVSLGGRDWLLAEIAAGRLVPGDRGLVVRRRRGVARDGGPRIGKCVYHGPSGCTLAHGRRSATCNYYVCDAVLEAPGGTEARRLRDGLADVYAAWDASLADELAAMGAPPAFDAALLDWLGRRFRELARSVDGGARPDATAPL
jgi:hypothetical protein